MDAELPNHLLKELAILTNSDSYLTACNNDDSITFLRDFCHGNFDKVLQTVTAKRIFSQTTTPDASTSFTKCLKDSVDHYFDKEDGDLPELDKELNVLLIATASLQLFVQNNWSGPCPTGFSPKDVLPAELTGKENYKDMIESELSVDGETVYHMTTHLDFLLIAKVLLFDCKDRLQHLQTADWWLIRCLNIQQQVLDDKANSLRETFIQLTDFVQRKEPFMVADCLREVQMLFHLEAGYLSHTFYRYREAKEHFQTAKKLSRLNVELSGAMGKRTRYQEDEKAQLILVVTREETERSENETKCTDITPIDKASSLPKNLNLEDDTVLDAINFSDDVSVTSLSAVEQALIVGLMENHRRSRASDDPLIEEEMQAYLSYALHEVKSWNVSTAALFIRSKMEKTRSRGVDRSMRQIEELYNQTKRDTPSAGQRLQLFYCMPLLPLWKVQGQLAEILLSLGAIGSALEIYERLQLWEQAIACYQRLGKVEKAETIIREQLAIKETPNLWCFLGDITRDISHYEKAWEMSKHRSARAQRCMGYLYFGKEDYEKCIECFERSLAVNGLQIPVWFTYGCAAMAAKDFTLAVSAFRRCVDIDYDNFEAWSNLSTAFVKLKEKKKAFKAMKEAIKCNYENWKIWDNMLVISVDCGEFSDTIQSYHRLLDLKEKWEDVQVLKALVTAVMENIPAANNQPASYLLPNTRELFGRITAKVTNNAEIWRLYASLYENDAEKSLQFLQKSHRCVMQAKDWEKEVEECEKVTEQSLLLADVYMQTMAKLDNQTQKLQMMSSAKLMLKGILSKIKQVHTDPISQEIPSEKVKEMCSSMEEKIQTILDEIQKLKS